jgi:hypothetical protein
MHYFVAALKVLIIVKLVILAVMAVILLRPVVRTWLRNRYA